MSKRMAAGPKNSPKSPSARKKQPSSKRSSSMKDLPLSTDRPAADNVKGGIKDSHDRYGTG